MRLRLIEEHENLFHKRELLLVIVAIAAGVLLSFYPMVFSGFSRMQHDPGDTRFNNYILEHSYRWVTGDSLHAELWSPPFFYPTKNTLAYSDTLLSLAPVYWGLRSFGMVPHVAFGVWMIVMSVLTSIAAYFLLRHGFRRSALGSCFGAWMMAYASSRIEQFSHQQLIGHFLTLIAIHALVVLFAHRPLSPKSRRICWGVFWGCFVTQFYAGFYFGFFLFLCLGLAFVSALCLRPMRAHLVDVVRQDLKYVLTTTVVVALSLAPLAWHYLMVASDVGMRGFSKEALPRLASYCYLGHTNILYGWLADWPSFRELPFRHEQAIGLGVATFLVTLWYLIKHREKLFVRLTVAIILSIVIFCTVFPGEITINRLWFYSIPGMRAIRVMSRIGMLFAIPAGIAIATLIDGQQRRRFKFAAVLVAMFCCLEQVHKPHSYQIETDRERIEPLIARLRQSGSQGPFYIEQQDRSRRWITPIDAMWISLEMGRPTINGYSGNIPPGYDLFNPEPENVSKALAAWNERYPDLSITTLQLIDSSHTQESTPVIANQPSSIE